MENKPIMLAQANALTQARYDFNPIEKRCLYQIIREVRRLFIDSNTCLLYTSPSPRDS